MRFSFCYVSFDFRYDVVMLDVNKDGKIDQEEEALGDAMADELIRSSSYSTPVVIAGVVLGIAAVAGIVSLLFL